MLISINRKYDKMKKKNNFIENIFNFKIIFFYFFLFFSTFRAVHIANIELLFFFLFLLFVVVTFHAYFIIFIYFHFYFISIYFSFFCHFYSDNFIRVCSFDFNCITILFKLFLVFPLFIILCIKINFLKISLLFIYFY